MNNALKFWIYKAWTVNCRTSFFEVSNFSFSLKARGKIPLEPYCILMCPFGISVGSKALAIKLQLYTFCEKEFWCLESLANYNTKVLQNY